MTRESIRRLTVRLRCRIRESRLVSTRNLIQGMEAAASKPDVFVGQSAIGYYGDRGGQLLDEESEPRELGFITEVVQDWEAAEREADSVAARTVVVRTGLVLSKHGGLLKQLLLPFKLGVGGPIAGGQQFMSW